MGASHPHALYHHAHSPVHALVPEVKVAATAAFVTAVAVTPREAIWAFGLHAAVLATVMVRARLPLRFVVSRLVVVLPFVAFALALPFVGGGETATMGGIEVSRDGLWATGNILAKSLLGAGASIVLVGTTEAPRILVGLERLRVPSVLTTIAQFMLRYLELIASELTRMRTAMAARGHDPRWLWQVRPLATGAGALFIRSYERGERVHAAMLGRGFTGSMPALDARTATAADWRRAASAPLVAWGITVTALVVA